MISDIVVSCEFGGVDGIYGYSFVMMGDNMRLVDFGLIDCFRSLCRLIYVLLSGGV